MYARAGRRRAQGAGGAVLARALQTGRPQVSGAWRQRRVGRPIPTPRCCPLLRRQEVIGALVLVGDARDPFTALDDRFLVALGQQVGRRAGKRRSLRRLEARTVELARLSARMIEQHEEERRRLSRELHDETAQVFSAVKMELGVLRDEVSAGAGGPARPRARTHRHRHPEHPERHQRPPALTARRPGSASRAALARGRFRRRGAASRSGSPRPTSFPRSPRKPSWPCSAPCRRRCPTSFGMPARIRLTSRSRRVGRMVAFEVRDDGRGPLTPARRALERRGHMGLAGMRERISALGGRVRFGADAGRRRTARGAGSARRAGVRA